MEKRLVLFAVLLTIFLSGCVTLEVTEVISKDGESQVTIKYDMRQLLAMAEEMSEEEGNETDFCADFQTEESNLIGATCSDEEGLVTITGIVKHTSEVFEAQSNIFKNKYTYYLSEGMSFVDQMGEDDVEGSFQGNQYLKSMGAEFTYNIEMPSKVSSSTHGTIDNNKVTIDLLEISENEEIIIVSEEYNYLFLVISAIVLLILILGLIYVIKSKSKKKSTDIPVNSEESYKI